MCKLQTFLEIYFLTVALAEGYLRRPTSHTASHHCWFAKHAEKILFLVLLLLLLLWVPIECSPSQNEWNEKRVRNPSGDRSSQANPEDRGRTGRKVGVTERLHYRG